MLVDNLKIAVFKEIKSRKKLCLKLSKSFLKLGIFCQKFSRLNFTQVFTHEITNIIPN